MADQQALTREHVAGLKAAYQWHAGEAERLRELADELAKTNTDAARRAAIEAESHGRSSHRLRNLCRALEKSPEAPPPAPDGPLLQLMRAFGLAPTAVNWTEGRTAQRELPDKPTWGMVKAGSDELQRIIGELPSPVDKEDDLWSSDEDVAQIYQAMVKAYRRGDGNWAPW